VEIFLQDSYEEPNDPQLIKRLDDEALVVHRRREGNACLVVFVHGLGGSRYGKNSTWGSFPKFFFEEIQQADIGLYEYRTLLGRAKFWKSVSLPDEAHAFADIIRDVAQYQNIFLVGHSMGGLLCMAAIAHLIDSRQQEVLSRIGGVILMATPQTGSMRVPTLMSWISKDFQALKPHGAFITDLHDTLVNNRVVLDDSRAQSGDLVIPTWAVLGASDHWVDKLSAGLNLPDARKKMVRGSHTEIVKPATKQSDAYEYVRDRIKQAFLRQTSATSTLSLPWLPLDEAFEGETPHFFRLLRWNYQLVENLIGRQEDVDAILKWAESKPNTPSARLITGEGGAGKTRLAATAAQVLRDRGWMAGFIDAQNDPFNVAPLPEGVFLIIDYPEEKPDQTKAALKGLAERKTSPFPLRVLFLSRRSFMEWEQEALLLEGRFGRQEIAAASALSVDDGVKLIEEAARRFAAHAKLGAPDTQYAKRWLESSATHRLPLFATAAAIHAVLSPREAFGLGHADLLKDLALREIRRVREASKALVLGEGGLERLLALAILADGLSESAVTELAKAGVCENPSSDIVSTLARSSWWKDGRLARLEPDAPAAAFLNLALFGPSFPRGRDALPEWLFLALRQKASTLGGRLARILYDLNNLRSLRPPGELTHPLEDRLNEMLDNDLARAEIFASAARSNTPFWSAGFAAQVAMILASKATDPGIKSAYLNNTSTYLSGLGRPEEALAAAQEALNIHRDLARARPEAFTPYLAASLSNLANRQFALGRPEQALAAAQEALDIRRDLALAGPEAFTPDLAMSLNNLGKILSSLGDREAALAAGQEAADLNRDLARERPEAFTPHLAMSLYNLADHLSALGRLEEALAAAREAADLNRDLARARPEVFTPDLAMSLDTLARCLGAVGRREAALAAVQESVNIHRDLARARPEAFTPVLAVSLNNLANRLSDVGREEEALAAAQESVNIYRDLARARPEAFTPDLAMSLNNFAKCLSDLERREESLAAVQESVNIYRDLARARPEAFTPDLAMSLNNFANGLAAVGHREAALAAAQEATDLFRDLARARPEAFTSRLAASLNNLANRLSAFGRREEALAAAREAADLCRDLARALPKVFTLELAMSLKKLADCLSALGRNEEALAAMREALAVAQQAKSFGVAE